MNSPIFPGMIAPIVLSEERFLPEMEKNLAQTGYVALNLFKVKNDEKSANENSGKFTSSLLKREWADDDEGVDGVDVIDSADIIDSVDGDDKADKADKADKKSVEDKILDGENSRLSDKSSKQNVFYAKDIFEVGVICKIVKKLKLPDGSVNLLVHGLKRYRAKKFLREGELLIVEPEIFEDVLETDAELDAYTRSVINQVKKLSELNPYFNEEMKLAMLNSPSSGALADLVAFALSLDIPEAQDFLETLVVKKRFAKLLVYLKREKDVAEIQKKITDEVNDKVNKYQKEYFLREQMKVIRHELGMEEDGKTQDVKKLEEDLKKAQMPNDVLKIAMEELGKLESVHDSSPEYNVIRTYLSWLSQLPWNKSTADTIDIKKSEAILERDHYGLEKPKERILEFLAVRKLRPQYDGTILCFTGPPGVGKTSLGKSIASSLGREFYRFSLGGMRDEAEIKGHRRTYVGAMPGKLIQALKRVEVNNPVIMLDEIDKMGQSFQGDPASALLEVLDPEQNVKFIDSYLDVPFDLSKVLFIATANYIEEIPGPLRDRMELIELSGYSLEEKLSIAKRWIIPKELKKHGLTNKDFVLSSAVMKKLIADYAREPGVRTMEQFVAKLCRKAAFVKVRGKGRDKNKFNPTVTDLEKHLGVARFQLDKAEKMLMPGVVIGLAWTPYGGDILRIESIPLVGKGFKITGQLGDVMNESATLAYSYVRKLLQDEIKIKDKNEKNGEKNKKDKNKKDKKDTIENNNKMITDANANSKAQDSLATNPRDFLANHEIHLHLPAGAIPKDGPSAGISMALALYSLSHNKKVKSSVAMTGELSLIGKVLPIGGLKEKVLAAKRAGMEHIIFPHQNVKDLKEVPERHRRGLKFYPVKHFKDVLKIALGDKFGDEIKEKSAYGK
ncbi:MAG: endopeptidase La [Oligoflexia bacterium]|nr:endopeptidase La [Oligoflexia bacterium]